MDKNMTVLVVEDILSARETVIHMLRALGFSRFLEAENGGQALEYVVRDAPGLIISDWNMPVMNGFDLLRKVRSMEGGGRIPFIFLTSKYESEDIALASEGGAIGLYGQARDHQGDLPKLWKRFSAAILRRISRNFSPKSGNCAFQDSRTRPTISCAVSRSCIPTTFPESDWNGCIFSWRFRNWRRLKRELCEILTANPLFTKAWETLANLQSRLGKWEQALGAANRMITISPNNARNYIVRGTINLHTGRAPRGQEEFHDGPQY